MEPNDQPQEPSSITSGAQSSSQGGEFRQKPSKRRRLWLLILVLVLLVLGVTGWILTKRPNKGPATDSKTSNSANQKPEDTQAKTYLYYAIQTSKASSGDREWPTFAIFQKTAGQQDEKELVKVGAVNAYPTDIVVDSKGKYLVVNYETKLTVYDTANGAELKSYPSEQKLTFSRPIFSPDLTQLFAFQVPAPGDGTTKKASATTIDLSSQKATTVSLTSDTPALGAQVWTKANTIVANFISYSEFTRPYLYDPSKKTVTLLGGGDSMYFIPSPTGQYIALPSGLIADASNCLSGDNANGLKVVDVATQKEVALYQDSKRAVRLVRFSQDETRLLVKAHDPATSGDCTAPTPKEDFVVVTLKPTSTKTVSEKDLVAEGFPLELSTAPDNAQNTKNNIIKYGEEVVKTVSVTTDYRLIGVAAR